MLRKTNFIEKQVKWLSLEADDQDSIPDTENDFLSPRHSNQLYTVHLPHYPLGTGGASMGVKREGDKSPPSSAVDKTVWNYIATLPS
jgi:hypothetical protein